MCPRSETHSSYGAGRLEMRHKSICVKHKGRNVAATFSVAFPETIDEALDYLGETRLLKLLNKQLELQARSTSRNLMSYEHTPASVKERMETEWFPFKRLTKCTPINLRGIQADGTDII